MIYAIVAIIIMIFGLISDFNKDFGLNKKAKIIHTIMLAILILSSAGLIDNLVSYFRNFKSSSDGFSNDMGIVPGGLNIIFYYANLIFSLMVNIFCLSLIFRKNYARKGLFILLPFWVLLYIVSFCRFLDEGIEILNLNNIIRILPGIIFFGGIAIAYIFLYTRQLMVSFFFYKDQSISGDV